MTESPSSYEIRAELEALRDQLADMRAQRDAALREQADLHGRIRSLRAACASAAETAEKALERLVAMQAVVDAAEALLGEVGDPALEAAVAAWQRVKPS